MLDEGRHKMATQSAVLLDQEANMFPFIGLGLLAVTAKAQDFASQCQNFNVSERLK